MKTPMLILLLVLNAVVLLGQVWSEGAPPFARVVNVLTLLLNMLTFLALLRNKNKSAQ